MQQHADKVKASARQKWTPGEVDRLQDMLRAGKNVIEISRKLKRTIQAVYARLRRISVRRSGPSK